MASWATNDVSVVGAADPVHLLRTERGLVERDRGASAPYGQLS